LSRRAIISDIHSNLVALEAVLEDIKTQNVDQIVCLGDVCGYGPQPIECVDRIRQTAAWTLKGNHDEALFIEPKDFGQNARAAIEWQKTIMEPHADSPPEQVQRWQWLNSLSPKYQEKDVVFVHASPRDPLYEYVLREDFHDAGLGPTQRAKDIFAAMDWLCFCGHSHRPGVVSEDFHWYLPGDLEGQSTIIKRGFKTIVNVGSVGQPRDQIPSACYCLFDYFQRDPKKTTSIMAVPHPDDRKSDNSMPDPTDDTRFGEELEKARSTALMRLPRVTFRRVEYNIPEAQARFRAVPQLPDGLARRLAEGK